ncbi:MAG: hypothetical protein AAF560_05795 [Acidobacteriota bacterium]
MKPLIQMVRRVLEHPLLPLALAVIAVLLCTPGLELGWVLDDYFLRAALTAPEALPEAARPPSQLFAWVGEHWTMAPGILPWWAADDQRIAFFRPLAGYSHWLDFKLWPESPRGMHVHSLAWRALAVIAAVLFFRRLAAPGAVWVAGLAGLIFALDDAHSIPAIWLSNRNSTLALCFSLLALLAYHRWRNEDSRRGSWGPAAWVAPVCLALALLSAEAAVACGAYLLSYALWLDRGPLKQRLLALAPCAGVGIAWLLIYRLLGYGATGSSAYIDPTSDPLRFLAVLAERAPILLAGQFGLPAPEAFIMLSQAAAQQAWRLGTGALVIFALLLTPLMRRSSQARFWAFGLLAAVVPSCAMYPGNRLLIFVSLGASGLLALFIADAWQTQRGRNTSWTWALRLLTIPLLLVHLAHNPRTTWATADNLSRLNTFLTGVADTLPADADVRDQQALIINAPSSYLTFYATTYLALKGQPIPTETSTLVASVFATRVHRPDARSLTVTPEGGFVMPAGTVPSPPPAPQSHFSFFLQTFDNVYYDGRPFTPGQSLDRRRIGVEIVRVTDDGRPETVTFRFDAELEDASWRWLQWQNGGYVAWRPPDVGETVTLPAYWPRDP